MFWQLPARPREPRNAIDLLNIGKEQRDRELLWTLFDLIETADRLLVPGISSKAVHGVGGKRDQTTRVQYGYSPPRCIVILCSDDLSLHARS
jgi:hypothetical protein